MPRLLSMVFLLLALPLMGQVRAYRGSLRVLPPTAGTCGSGLVGQRVPLEAILVPASESASKTWLGYFWGNHLGAAKALGRGLDALQVSFPLQPDANVNVGVQLHLRSSGQGLTGEFLRQHRTPVLLRPCAFDRAEVVLEEVTDDLLSFGKGLSPRERAILCGHLAMACYERGQATEALALLKATQTSEAALTNAEQCCLANNEALILFALGRFAEAEVRYRQCLSLIQAATATRFAPEALRGPDLFALLSPLTMGRSQAYTHVVPEQRGPDRTLALKVSPATVWGGLGNVLLKLGHQTDAEAALKQAVAILEAEGKPDRPSPELALALNNLGACYTAWNQFPQAEACFQRALELDRRTLDPMDSGVAIRFNGYATLLRRQGRFAEAAALLKRAVAINAGAWGELHPNLAIALTNYGGVLQELGVPGEAALVLSRAYGIALARENATLRWIAPRALFTLYATRQPALAVYYGKQATAGLQQIRSHLLSLPLADQRRFLETVQMVYAELANLLIQQGRLPEALQVLAMLKVDELQDVTRGEGSAVATPASLTGQERSWEARFRELQERMAALGSELGTLEQQAALGSLSTEDTARRTRLEADLEVGRQAFEAFLAKLHLDFDTASAERNREVGQMNLPALVELRGTLETLGHGAVALHYVVAPGRVAILLTTPQTQLARSFTITPAELNTRIMALRTALQDPRVEPRPLAQALFRILIAPVLEDLKQAHAETLMLSLDGALRYVPFAALHDGQHYLVEGLNLVLLTDAAKGNLKDAPAPKWQVAGMGLTQAREGFKALPAVRDELEGIVKAGNRGVLPGTVALDQDFTLARLQSALDRRVPVLHLASHFKFQAGSEGDSFLLLGEDRLTLEKVKSLKFTYVDLLTLSACETAVGGGRDGNGREIEGFGALAQLRGAKGVIATLWPVDDTSTGRLMQTFYRLREAQQLTKAEALRRAQLTLLRGEGPVPTSAARGGTQASKNASGPDFPYDSNKPFAHPYYWGPFILMGNWR